MYGFWTAGKYSLSGQTHLPLFKMKVLSQDALISQGPPLIQIDHPEGNTQPRRTSERGNSSRGSEAALVNTKANESIDILKWVDR